MYPLKFKPVFQKRVWGGNRLRTVLNKAIDVEGSGPIGESWELADLPAGTVQVDSAGAAADGSLSSVITNGPLGGKTLHEAIKAAGIIKDAAGTIGYFPLLVKFLDAQTNLSVQVHPDAAYAAKHPEAHLKSEAWYVVHAEPGAKIYKGVKAGVTREELAAALETGDVEPLLNAIRVRPGDCHYLQSGTVHALGAGILAAEVQTPSDTTFRVFDWNRLGADGKPRRLHVAEALECIDFGLTDEHSGGPRSQETNGATAVMRLVTCEHFTIDRVSVTQNAQQDISPAQPVVWIVLEGQGVINVAGYPPTAFVRGDTLLLPTSMNGARVKTLTDCVWLEAKLPTAARQVGES